MRPIKVRSERFPIPGAAGEPTWVTRNVEITLLGRWTFRFGFDNALVP